MVYGGLQNTPFVNPRKNFSVIPKPFQSVSKTQSSKALEAKMGVGKPKRRPQHNVSVTRAPPYKVLQRNLNPFEAKWGKTQATGKVSHTRRQGCSPRCCKSMDRNLSPLKQNGGKRGSPFRDNKVSHTRRQGSPQYKCWNTDLNNRPKEKRRWGNPNDQRSRLSCPI